jgi:Domain of unknown function (DUF4328)
MSDPRIARTEARAATFARVTVVFLVLGAIGLAFAINQLVFDVQQRAAIVAGLPRATELSESHTALADLGRVLPIVFGGAIVSWLAWQFEAHLMLWRTSATRPRFRPAVGVAAWAVPAANVVAPPLAMAELWHKSDPRESPAKGFVLIFLWWVVLLATLALAALALVSMTRSPVTNHDLVARDWYFVGASACALLGTPLAVALIAGVNGRQRFGMDGAQGNRTWSELRVRRDAS